MVAMYVLKTILSNLNPAMKVYISAEMKKAPLLVGQRTTRWITTIKNLGLKIKGYCAITTNGKALNSWHVLDSNCPVWHKRVGLVIEEYIKLQIQSSTVQKMKLISAEMKKAPLLGALSYLYLA